MLGGRKRLTSLCLPPIAERRSAPVANSALRAPQIRFGGYLRRGRQSPVDDYLYPAIRLVLLA
jgi:hypothetical protein